MSYDNFFNDKISHIVQKGNLPTKYRRDPQPGPASRPASLLQLLHCWIKFMPCDIVMLGTLKKHFSHPASSHCCIKFMPFGTINVWALKIKNKPLLIKSIWFLIIPYPSTSLSKPIATLFQSCVQVTACMLIKRIFYNPYNHHKSFQGIHPYLGLCTSCHILVAIGVDDLWTELQVYSLITVM